MGRALAGHFALANWLLGILRELIFCTLRIRRLFVESMILPPNGLDLRQTPQLRFSSIAKGLDTSRWAKPSQSRVRVQSKVHQSRIAIWLTLFLMVFHTGCNLRIIHFFKPWIEVGLWPLGVAVAR